MSPCSVIRRQRHSNMPCFSALDLLLSGLWILWGFTCPTNVRVDSVVRWNIWLNRYPMRVLSCCSYYCEVYGRRAMIFCGRVQRYLLWRFNSKLTLGCWNTKNWKTGNPKETRNEFRNGRNQILVVLNVILMQHGMRFNHVEASGWWLGTRMGCF